MKKGLLIAGIALIAAGIVLMVGGFVASGFDIMKLDTTPTVTTTHPVTETFRNVEIVVGGADVTLQPSEDGTCRVLCDERENAPYTVTVENGTLKIGTDIARKWYEWLSFSFRSPSITVYLPTGTYDTLTVSTGTGDVRVHDLHAKNFDLSVSTGLISVQSTTCDETLSIDVSTGSTSLTDVTCKTLASNGSTGGIAMVNTVVSGSMDLTRSTGDISFDGCDAGQISAHTTTGSITGTLLTGKAFTAHSTTGSVRVPDSTSGDPCELITTTGDIAIRLAG